MMQTEVGEAFEPSAPGRGGSSTMPHKRNPVACAQILTASTLAPGLVAGVLSGMVQEHERALGGWQAEWVALPQLFLLASGVAGQLAETAKGIEVDTDRMRDNLEITNGLIMAEAVQMALGEKIGRMQAHDLLEPRASVRQAKDGICAKSSPKCRTSPAHCPPSRSTSCSIRSPISAAPNISSIAH
jgi:3-carboxy-cis,cis-muconate cycloisomerase